MGYSKVPIGGRYNLRKYRRRIDKLGLNVKNLIFPIPPKSLAWVVLGMAVLHMVGAAPFQNSINIADGVFAAFIG
uniref:Uncharacterized protein n=1 Tax=Plectus sambesii TaxID=2011161 RepID=A0A914WB73_9BILA